MDGLWGRGSSGHPGCQLTLVSRPTQLLVLPSRLYLSSFRRRHGVECLYTPGCRGRTRRGFTRAVRPGH